MPQCYIKHCVLGVTNKFFYPSINYINRVVTTFIEIHSFGPIATKLGTEVPKRVTGWTMKERVWRVYYFKGESEQKQMEHAGIECTTLMCLSERSNLRASMHNALSMAFCVSVGPIEHRRRTAATESVRKHSQPTHPLTFEPTEGTRDGVELP